MNIQAVFFDMGGTIETFNYTRELRLKATLEIQQRLLLAGIDLHLDNEEFYEVISHGLARYKSWSTQTLEELPSRYVWHDFILSEYPVEMETLAKVAEDLMFLIETRFYRRKMRPEIPSVLEAIQKMGLKIGLISNVNSRGQVPANLKEYGIIDYFDPIVLSSEYGRRKPDPSIFHYAARLANVPASECVYVGDRVVRDVEGARRAGFGLAIQIRHDFEHGEVDSGAQPDFVIADMTALIAILKTRLDCADPVASASRAIRGILFDAGDILYHRPNRGSFFRSFLHESSLDVLPNHAAEKEALSQKAYRGIINQEQLQEAVLQMYGITQPEQVERGKQALKNDENNVEFFEGVQQTLISLKEQGYLLGIVTDTANPIHAKLNWFERGGFGHIWDSLTSSMELGTRKPDPQIYLAALQQLGLTPAQAVFVGHKASELDGARAVGMRTIAFNYDPDARADYFIKRFSDLLDVPILKTLL